MVVVMALRVEGEPWAQMRRSLPVYASPISQCVLQVVFRAATNRHDLPSLPQNPQLGTHIEHRTIQTPTRPFHQPRYKKHPRLPRYPLQVLSCPVTPKLLILCNWQPPLYPIIPSTGGSVTYIDGAVEVMEELLVADRITRPNGGAEGACPGVPTEVGFWEEDEMDPLRGCFMGGLGESLEGFGSGGKGAGLSYSELQGLGHDCV